jgi:APA family basic amino acid/polyamine antiporter
MDVANRFWTSISGVTLISAISAALVGSMFSSVAWEGNFIAGEIKIQNVMLVSLFYRDINCKFYYIIANFMYLCVPLQEIATAESDRVAVVASQYIFVLVTLLIGDDYDFDFCL